MSGYSVTNILLWQSNSILRGLKLKMLQKHHIDNIENILEVLILAIYFGSLLPRKQ